MQDYSRMEKSYNSLLIILPIMMLYGFSFLPNVTFSDYILLFFLITDFYISFFRGQYRVSKSFLGLVIYLLVQPMLLGLYGGTDIDWLDAIGSSWKLAIYVYAICSVSFRYCRTEILLKMIRAVGILSTAYSGLQLISGTLFHVPLTPYIPFLPVLREGLDDQQLDWINYGLLVRPRAWFSEPSTLAIFLLLALLVEVFLTTDKNRHWKYCIIYFLGIIFSNSSTGFMGFLIVILLTFLFYSEKFIHRMPKILFIVGAISIPVVIILLYRSGYLTSILIHTFADGEGMSSQSHFRDIYIAFQNGFGVYEVLFGHGLQEVAAGYLPGWIRTYYCLGITGIILYIVSFSSIIFRIDKKRRIIVLTFILLNIGTEIMLGVYILLYMSVAIAKSNNADYS